MVAAKVSPPAGGGDLEGAGDSEQVNENKY